jgi:hypothetical protein
MEREQRQNVTLRENKTAATRKKCKNFRDQPQSVQSERDDSVA